MYPRPHTKTLASGLYMLVLPAQLGLLDQGLGLDELASVDENHALIFYASFMLVTIMLLLNIFLGMYNVSPFP